MSWRRRSSVNTLSGGEILAALQLVAAVALARVTLSICRLEQRAGSDVVAVGLTIVSRALHVGGSVVVGA